MFPLEMITVCGVIAVPVNETCIPLMLSAPKFVSRFFPMVAAGRLQLTGETNAVTWFLFPAGGLKLTGTLAVIVVVAWV